MLMTDGTAEISAQARVTCDFVPDTFQAWLPILAQSSKCNQVPLENKAGTQSCANSDPNLYKVFK